MMADSERIWVRNVVNSSMKSLLGFGGRYMLTITVGVGPFSFIARDSKERDVGRVTDETFQVSR